MKHIDLFSGIGGFALAVDEVFGKSEHIFCEIDPYCQALLKKRFKGAMIYGDIRTLSRERLTADTDNEGRQGRMQPKNFVQGSEERFIADTESERINRINGNDKQAPIEGQGCLRESNGSNKRQVDILTGGFPCQPFSQAGKRKGTDDNRYLWPEMLRVIRDFKPTWVIAENVRGILSIEGGMVFEQVCLDLEGEGYEVQPFIIPAVAVNAPHRRDRVWFVGHAKSERGKTEECKVCERAGTHSNRGISNAPDTSIERCDKREPGDNRPGKDETPDRFTEESWARNWLEVATELCGVDDGLPAELDGLKLSKSRHRVERLKALGNAIVPQVAVEIMHAIRNTTKGGRRNEYGK